MALIPRDRFFDIDRIFDEFWAPSRESRQSTFFSPSVDIKEKDDHYEITAELPGVKKEDLHVTLNEGVLTIEAEARQEEKEEKEGRIIRQERRFGKFLRSFNLGDNVREEDIAAEFNDGILTLRAPKSEPKVPAQRRIEVK